MCVTNLMHVKCRNDASWFMRPAATGGAIAGGAYAQAVRRNTQVGGVYQWRLHLSAQAVI